MGETQLHHANWTRRDWQHVRDHSLRKMRNHAGLIVPAFEPNHRLLHVRMSPTPMPVHEVADNLLEELGRSEEVGDRLAGFKKAARFLMAEAMTSPKPYYAESSHGLALHYVEQLGYLALSDEAAIAALEVPYQRVA